MSAGTDKVGTRKSARKRTVDNAAESSQVQKRRGRLTNSQRLARDAARYAVFNTAELVENIIVHLPARRIFVAQRVSKIWHETIKRSKPIRLKLFITSDHLPPQKWRPMILARCPLLCKGTTSDAAPVTLSSQVSSNRVSVRLNPLLKMTNDYDRWIQQYATSGICFSFTIEKSCSFLWGIPPEPGPSFWRNTYVTDPPCPQLLVFAEWNTKGPVKATLKIQRRVVDENGITMRTLLDELMYGRDIIWCYLPRLPETLRNATLKEAIESFESRFGQQNWGPPRLQGVIDW